MTTTKSTKPARPSKPSKDFRLFAHASGKWAKNVRGRLHYFGVWADADSARRRYERQRVDLEASRKPQPAVDVDGITVADVCNRFLTSKQRGVDAGELFETTCVKYHRTTGRLVRVFGRDRTFADLRSDDFATLRDDISKMRGPVSVGNEFNRTWVICKFAYNSELISKPHVDKVPTFKDHAPRLYVLSVPRAASGV